MKVLHIAETIKGGVGTVIDELVEYQSKKENGFMVCCLVPEQHVDGLFKSKNLALSTFDRKKRNWNSLYNLYVKMKSVIQQEKPDIIHFHSTFAGFIGRLFIFLSGKKNEIKIIYSPHAFAFLMKKNFLKRKLYSIIEYFLSFITDKIICVSDYEYNEAIKIGLEPSRLVVVHNGVAPSNPEFFKKIDIKEKVNFLFVGRFDYQKGIDVLLNSIKLLTDEEKGKYFFNLVGDVVNEKSDTQLLSDDITRCVTLHGWLTKSKIIEQFKAADCIIIPSRWEGFAMVPLEAMAHGTPVILSNIPPFMELIEGKSNGIMFRSDDSLSLLKAIRSLESKELMLLRDNAFEILKENYTDVEMNKKTAFIYRSISG